MRWTTSVTSATTVDLASLARRRLFTKTLRSKPNGRHPRRRVSRKKCALRKATSRLLKVTVRFLLISVWEAYSLNLFVTLAALA